MCRFGRAASLASLELQTPDPRPISSSRSQPTKGPCWRENEMAGCRGWSSGHGGRSVQYGASDETTAGLSDFGCRHAPAFSKKSSGRRCQSAEEVGVFVSLLLRHPTFYCCCCRCCCCWFCWCGWCWDSVDVLRSVCTSRAASSLSAKRVQLEMTHPAPGVYHVRTEMFDASSSFLAGNAHGPSQQARSKHYECWSPSK